MKRRATTLIALAAIVAACAAWPVAAQEAARAPEPNTRVPAGVVRYAPTVFPDRIIASPAPDAATGFSVAWRTDATLP